MSAPRTLARATLPLLVFVLLLAGLAASAFAEPGPWTTVPAPWPADAVLDDVWPIGATGLALAGDEGRVYLSPDGGATWDVVAPPGQRATVFTAVAIDTSGEGALASGGLLLATTDGGLTWHAPVYTGEGPTSVNDLAVRGARAVAVCDGGVILESADGAQTWSRSVSPASADLTAVALAGDGTAVVGGSGGEVLVGRGGAWTVAAVATAPVTAVAASATPVWSDGTADLFAASGAGVLGSDDGVLFAPLPGVPDLTGADTPQLAWAGLPSPSLLVTTGGGFVGFSLPATGAWRSGVAGVPQALRAAAPGGQSVAYVLGADGRLVRTLSAGLRPATLVASRARLTVGQTTRLRATVDIGAKGTLRLGTRLPGGAWQTLRSAKWTVSDWGRQVTFDASPSLTHEYRLDFAYGGTVTQLTPATTIVAAPRITTARSRYDLRTGDVFRFSGTVAPVLHGARVELLTNRGGGWRPVSGSAKVKLRKGHTWTSRAFGTPKAETYKLRAHLATTARHGEAWSRIVTVTIRR